MKAAVFSCPGLGDGLISIALANNLYLNNYEVVVFHRNLGEMQSWIPYLPIKEYPKIDTTTDILNSYDQMFISYDGSNDFIMKLINDGKNSHSAKLFVLNPCPSKKIGSQPYYEDALFNPRLCMVDNIDLFCKRVLNLKKTSKKINISNSEDHEYKKHKKRVIIHPTSAKLSKNWPIEKYIKLVLHLKGKGFDPIFIVSDREKDEFLWIEKHNLKLKSFHSLNHLTSYVFESSFMIGNDSGIGHLASFLGLSTVSIFRNYRTAHLWRPGWSKGEINYPNKFIPNVSFLRLRDKHWKKFISVSQMVRSFYKLNSF